MKFAKKMQLVEIGDMAQPTRTNNNIYADDESYSKPRVLSSLDNIMNEILKAPMSDGDKWKLYSQALHRYLNHAKFASRNTDHNISQTVGDNETDPSAIENPFNFSSITNFPPHSFDIPHSSRDNSQFDVSGVSRMRDSLESISQPSVRNFFESYKTQNNSGTSNGESLAQSPPKQKKKKKFKKSSANRVLPFRNAVSAATNKRRAENSLRQDVSQMRPLKVMVSRLQHWESSNAR